MRLSRLKTFSSWAFALILLALSNVAEAETLEGPSLFAKYIKRSNTLHERPRFELSDASLISSGQDEGDSRRSLLATQYYNCACASWSMNIYYGECPALNDKSDQWCDLTETCCASSEEDCCVPNSGAVAGVVIACILTVVGSITACAYCCKCCCFKPKPQVVTIAAMQLPTFVQQPVAAGVPVQPAATGKFCAKCGNGLDAQAGFCPGCGAQQ